MSMLIAFGGQKEHGKDAAASFLVDEFGFTLLGMSDPILEAMLTIDPMVQVPPNLGIRSHDRANIYGLMHFSRVIELCGYTEAKRIPEVRRMLQALGTEVGRQLDENLWVNAAAKRIVAHLNAGTSVTITGMRFPNELAMVAELGGLLVWVDRPGYGTDGDTHVSEHSVTSDDFDTIIVNDGTLMDLRDRTLSLTRESHGRKVILPVSS